VSADRARPKVALVIGHLGYGGAERQLYELAVGGRHGAEFHVFCLGGAEEPYGPALREAGVPVIRIPRRGSFDLARALGLASHLRGRGFDIAHSFLIDANPYAWFAAYLSHVPAFIASNRNADFPRGGLRSALDGWVFRRARRVLVNGQAVAAFTARRFGVALDRFVVIYNGVDLSRFHPPPEHSSSSRTLGTVGSLYAKKNPELFAEVAAAIRAADPDVRCLHLGDGPLRESLAERFAGTVEFLGSSAAVADFLRALDVFVLTSSREGTPNVLLEAMACGRACVATGAGAVAEIVRDGLTGFVVPIGDRGALIDRARALLADVELRQRVGSAARRDVETRFAVPRMVDETLALYRAVLAERSATSVLSPTSSS